MFQSPALFVCGTPDFRHRDLSNPIQSHRLPGASSHSDFPSTANSFIEPLHKLHSCVQSHSDTMSYAEIASKGPKQTPEEAAAPQPPQVSTADSASSSSLIDVDAPSVRTVPSDFASQDVQTDTQAARIDLEAETEEAAEAARAEAELAKKRHHKKSAAEKKKKVEEKVSRAEGWLVKRLGLEGLGEGGAAGAVAGVNLAVLVGVSGWLGFRAWGLYDRGRLGAREVGLGLGLLGAVGVVEGVLVRFLSKARSKEQ